MEHCVTPIIIRQKFVYFLTWFGVHLYAVVDLFNNFALNYKNEVSCSYEFDTKLNGKYEYNQVPEKKSY